MVSNMQEASQRPTNWSIAITGNAWSTQLTICQRVFLSLLSFLLVFELATNPAIGQEKVPWEDSRGSELLARWKENASNLGTIWMSYTTTTEIPGRKNKEIVKLKTVRMVPTMMGDKVVPLRVTHITELLPALTKRKMTVTALADEVYAVFSNDGRSSDYYYNGEHWYEYRFGQDIRIKRRTEQMGSRRPSDPRAEVFYFNNIPIQRILAEASYSSAESEQIVTAAFIPKPNQEGKIRNELQIDFDMARKGIPVASRMLLCDKATGSREILNEITVEYQHIKSRNAYLASQIKSVLPGFLPTDGIVTKTTVLAEYELLDTPLSGTLDSFLPQTSHTTDLTTY